MSDTPETDAAWDKYINPYTYSAGDLRILAERLERERDEWAAMCGRYKQERDIAEQDATNFHARIFELINERDEARAAIPAGEWVAYKDHQKIHDAASRLLVAINKQLPIGCFILINSEYHRLQNAIYGREGAK
jgi:hypothetical protein